MIDFICHQCFNNFLEVEPPKKDNITDSSNIGGEMRIGPNCKTPSYSYFKGLYCVNTGPKRSQVAKNVTPKCSTPFLTVKRKVSLSFANTLNLYNNCILT